MVCLSGDGRHLLVRCKRGGFYHLSSLRMQSVARRAPGGLTRLILTLLAIGTMVAAVVVPTAAAAEEGEQDIGQQLHEMTILAGGL